MKKFLTLLISILIFGYNIEVKGLEVIRNVYPKAWDYNDFPGNPKSLISREPKELNENYQYERIYSGYVAYGINSEDFKETDYVYITYPTEFIKASYQDEVITNFKTRAGKDEAFHHVGKVEAEAEIKQSFNLWEEISQEPNDVEEFKVLEINGQPAVSYKKIISEMHYHRIIKILLEEKGKNIPDTFICLITCNVEMTFLKSGMGGAWTENLPTHLPKIERLWESIQPEEQGVIDEALSFQFVLNREQLYKGSFTYKQTIEDYNKQKEKKKASSEDKLKKTLEEIHTQASKTKEEVSVSIPSAVMVGVLSVGATVMGASSAKVVEEEKKKKNRFKMCLTKDFRDAIRIGAAPVSVYARIVEINENGTEIDRPDLTKQITIRSKGYLEVEKNQMVGNYMGALVYAPDDRAPSSEVISFEFNGDMGTFINNVTFRIIDKPYIEFPEKFDYVTMTLNLILGDNEIYETPFIPRDFFDEPTKVTVKASEGAPFEVEYEKVNEDKYILRVTNKSIKANRVLLNSINGHINITMENELEKAEDIVNILILPEGLSISKVDIEDDKMQVQTFNDKEELQPVRFHVNLVVKENEKVLNLKPNKFEPIFEQIKGTSKSTDNLVTKFNYDIEPLQSNFKSYNFIPYDALIEDKNDPYIIILPISCEYNSENYTLEVPIKLLGGDSGPMEARNKELDKMRDIVRKLGLSPKTARFIRENIDTLSAKEIRLINRQICQEARDYFSKDAEELQKIANKLENLEYWFDWIKWLGDQAFSYLMTIYAGSGEIILTPAKEMAVEFIAELYADYVDGQPIDANRLSKGLENLQVISKIDGMLEDFIMDVATGKDISVKKAGTCLAGWFMYKVAKNVQDNIEKTGNYEIFDAILGAGSDLTAKALKKLGMQQFKKLITNSSFGEKFGKWFESFAGEHLKNNYKLFYDENNLLQIEDIITRKESINQLMSGLMGEGIKWVFSKFKGEPLKDAGKQVQSYERISLTHDYKIKIILITPNEKTKEGYVAELDIINSIEGLFNLFFENVFGFVPFESKPVEPPNDPTLYKNN